VIIICKSTEDAGEVGREKFDLA